MGDKPDAIYLNNEKLVHWPVPGTMGAISYTLKDAKTELTKSRGMDHIEFDDGGYIAVASAAVYEAIVSLKGDKTEVSEDIDLTNSPEEHFLFDGSVSIYGKGDIEGTYLSGYSLLRTGKIWTAVPKDEQGDFPSTHRILFDLVMGPGVGSDSKHYYARGEYLERILKGYDIQEKEANERAKIKW